MDIVAKITQMLENAKSFPNDNDEKEIEMGKARNDEMRATLEIARLKNEIEEITIHAQRMAIMVKERGDYIHALCEEIENEKSRNTRMMSLLKKMSKSKQKAMRQKYANLMVAIEWRNACDERDAIIARMEMRIADQNAEIEHFRRMTEIIEINEIPFTENEFNEIPNHAGIGTCGECTMIYDASGRIIDSHEIDCPDNPEFDADHIARF
jgi:hypothetical protein